MKQKPVTFENDLHEEMRAHGLLFPISDKEIERFEAKFTRVPLPDALKSADQILLRNKERIQTTTQPVFQVAALTDNADQVITGGRKRKKKK